MAKLSINDLLYPKAAAFIEYSILKQLKKQGAPAEQLKTFRPMLSQIISQQVSVLKDAQVFLVEKDFHDTSITVVADIDPSKLNLSPPFPTCYFEVNDKELSLSSMGSADDPEKVGVHAILVHEVSPGSFTGWLFLADSANQIAVEPFIVGPRPQATDELVASFGVNLNDHRTINSVAGKLFERLCNYIHDCNLGVEYIHRNIKFKTITNGKCEHKLQHVIRMKKTIRRDFPEPAFVRNIDWDMRWWVRGHWRKLPAETIQGKNRNGEYEVNGFTWVTEHLRGPEEAPIKKAIYTMGNECSL